MRRASIRRALFLLLAPLGMVAATGATVLDCNQGTVQDVVVTPGYVEPHTPGSGSAVEIPASAAVVSLLGSSPDLNQVVTVRTRKPKPSAPPRAIMILIPGFLGGATTFDPIAHDLVDAMAGSLEVWAVDRRPNMLEDRLGSRYAAAGAALGGCGQPGGDCSTIFEGAQFYFPDADVDPVGDFPGPGDFDVNLNGVLDPQRPLLDDLGASRVAIPLAQDDVRFMAHWGIDTYMRDWATLVAEARAIVGPQGIVLLGGHSQGTSWSTTFAAYDLDPDPANVVAGHALIDGLVLLEGGGVGPGASVKPTLTEYEATVTALEAAGGPNVFLADFSGISLADLSLSSEISAVAAFFQPSDPSLIQRTPTFGGGLLGTLLAAPSTNEAVVGFFLDDDFSPNAAFSASFGWSDNGPNSFLTLPGFVPFYLAGPGDGSALRAWRGFEDPALPVCALGDDPAVGPGGRGCAINDNGAPSGPGESPRVNGVEREVTSIQDFLKTQFGKANGLEWYFVDGRVSQDFQYGNDSSALVSEALAVDPADEGPLRVTQQGGMDVPVIAIGGSNGLTPELKSFDRYFGSIITPIEDREAIVIEGYAHLDVINARDNDAVPPIVDWVSRQIQRKLLASF